MRRFLPATVAALLWVFCIDASARQNWIDGVGDGLAVGETLPATPIPPSNGGGVAGGTAAQFSNSIQDLIEQKNSRLSENVANPPEVLVGGETIGLATPLGVPAATSGNTCGGGDDYDEACPFTGSTSPDNHYEISGVNGRVTIDLCNSEYDTKVYVYENTAGNLVACNDDACSDPYGNPFRSLVTCVNMTADNNYIVVVDGYFGDCGNYNLYTSFSIVCPEVCASDECPPGSLLEGEPVCGPNYVDAFNGGCNSTPNVFSQVPCHGTVCGTGGTYTFNGYSYRDTDWYQFSLPIALTVTVSMCPSFDAQLAAIDGNVGCGFITSICGPVSGPEGSTLSCNYSAPAGLNWIFAAPSAFAGVPCGSPYYLTFEGCTVSNATEGKTWGQIKGMFR